MKLRSATKDDVDDVLAFWEVAAEGRSVTDDRAGVLSLLARDPDALTLADDDGEIVGSVIAGWDGWRCHLYRVAVHPDRRREGIGRALIDAAEDRFAALAGRRVDAMVLDDNTDAHTTWNALGYTREDHWSRWVKPLP